jgi:nucleoside-diphosphate-sugar epimerase
MPQTIGNILVTGATGFIGSRLRSSGRALVRSKLNQNDVVGDLLNPDSLHAACSGIDTVFHCAGYAHAFTSSDSSQHWRVNYEGTRNLIEAAGKAGVKRFIFLSSVKAMAPPGNQCVDELWPGDPTSAYGLSKRAAEEVVLASGLKYGMGVVNLRLAMVYGQGGRGNLERMALAIKRGWFPPLPDTNNQRSLVHVSDVISAMFCVARNPNTYGKTFIVADAYSYSGQEIYKFLREALGLPALGSAIPVSALRSIGVLGDIAQRIFKVKSPVTSELISRLLDSECYCPKSIEQTTGWRAQMNLKQGLQEMIGEK